MAATSAAPPAPFFFRGGDVVSFPFSFRLRSAAGDVVITADIPLASRCVKAGADVIAPNGKPFTEQSIGMTLAVRNLMTDLRSSGEITGGPKSYSPRDRSTFLSTLDQTIRRIQRRRAEQATTNQQG